MSAPTVRIDKLDGVNNRLPPERLQRRSQEGALDFVQSAVNGNFTDAGTFRRREGSVKTLAGGDCHSFWADAGVGFMVDGVDLLRITLEAGEPTQVVIAQVTPGLQMSYAKPVNDVYLSNGVQRFRTDSQGQVSEWGVPVPQRTPSTNVTSAGQLMKGRYQLVVSHLSADGEEGGTTFPLQVSLGSTGAIELTDIPQLPGHSTLIYCTSCDGDIFYKVGATTGSSFVIASTNEYGQRPIGLLMNQTPPGNIVRQLNGRLLVAAGNILFYSEPYNFGLYNPARNYIPFPAPITMVEPCQNGFFVSADQTYWVDGEISEADLNPVLPYKAIAGTSAVVPNQNAVWWMSERGAVLGTQDGQVQNLQEKNVAVDPGVVGASLFREQDGMKQMISTMFGPQSTVMSASSFMEAEIIRKETIL